MAFASALEAICSLQRLKRESGVFAFTPLPQDKALSSLFFALFLAAFPFSQIVLTKLHVKVSRFWKRLLFRCQILTKKHSNWLLSPAWWIKFQTALKLCRQLELLVRYLKEKYKMWKSLHYSFLCYCQYLLIVWPCCSDALIIIRKNKEVYRIQIKLSFLTRKQSAGSERQRLDKKRDNPWNLSRSRVNFQPAMCVYVCVCVCRLT